MSGVEQGKVEIVFEHKELPTYEVDELAAHIGNQALGAIVVKLDADGQLSVGYYLRAEACSEDRTLFRGLHETIRERLRNDPTLDHEESSVHPVSIVAKKPPTPSDQN